MGSSTKTKYSALTKAVEHLGVYGEADLVAAMPYSFLPVEREDDARSHLALLEPDLALEAAG
jgi:hypothetical protein